MNKAVIASLLLVMIANTGAVYLKHGVSGQSQTYSQLRDINDSDFGKRILDTIALQLNNKSPLSDVAKMLADIRQNLALQQQEAESLHAAQEIECADTIAELDNTITVCQANADDAAEQIGVLKSEIKALDVKITQMGNQLEILAARQSALALAREQDHADFLRRQEQGPSVLAALDLIVEKLRTITPTSVSDAFVELSKLGKSNPIAALLQVASTFSAETLESVIQKMIDLHAAIEASLEADVAAEEEAAAEFKKINGEIEGTRKNVTAAKQESESQKKQKEASLALQEKRLAENTQCVLDSQAKKQAKIEQCASWRAKYETDKVNRAAEIEIIEQVQTIVATKLDTMKDYLKDAANAE